MTSTTSSSTRRGWADPAHGVGAVGTTLAAAVALWPPTDTGILGRLTLAGWLLLATWIAAVDTREHRIPNHLNLSLAALSLLAVAGQAALDRDPQSALLVITGAFAATAVALMVHIGSSGAIGMGDVKLMFPVALVLGWIGAEAAWAALLVTPILASLVLVYRAAAGLVRDPVPLAPFLVGGVATGLLVG